MSAGLGGTFFAQGSGPTLADLLQYIPDHSYTEGVSVFADLAMTLVSNYFSNNCHCSSIIILAFVVCSKGTRPISFKCCTLSF
jgi:hypothetical protein